MQWFQHPNQSNVDNLNSVRCEAIRHFRSKKIEYLKAKIYEFETNSKIKNIRDLYRSIIDFKKGYQCGINIVKDERGVLVTDSHSILARWRNHFSQLFDVTYTYHKTPSLYSYFSIVDILNTVYVVYTYGVLNQRLYIFG
jgi:hypothetical protein